MSGSATIDTLQTKQHKPQEAPLSSKGVPQAQQEAPLSSKGVPQAQIECRHQ